MVAVNFDVFIVGLPISYQNQKMILSHSIVQLAGGSTMASIATMLTTFHRLCTGRGAGLTESWSI